MDLHRPFKMDSPSYLPPPLASPALMVLASTAESGRDASVPCQAPRPFGVPVSMSEKDLHLPFPSASYTFTSMYHHHHHHHRQGGGGGGGGGAGGVGGGGGGGVGPLSGSFAPRDFPASLLHHLHPHFNPPGLDCSPLSMLNHGGLQGAFRPFSSPHEERDLGPYHSAFTPAKRLKGSFGEAEGKEFGGDFGPPGGGALKAGEDPAGRKLFSVSGLLSDREASSSPEELQERIKVKALYDSQAPVCPVCQTLLRPGEFQEHMEQELAKVAQLQISIIPVQRNHLLGTPKSLSLSLHIKHEGGSPSSPLRTIEDVHSDRYQTFLRVRANRHTRLNVDDLCWCRCYVKSAPLRPHSAGAHLDCVQAVRIGKLKKRKQEESQEGPAELAPLEDEWNDRRKIQMTSTPAGFKGAGLGRAVSRECQDSDVDLDVDGDDTLEYGRAQYTETDIIPCSGESSKETAVNGPDSRVNLEYPKWPKEEGPSTSSGESNKGEGGLSGLHQTCQNSEIEMVTENSALTTLDALKARIRDLEKQLSKGDRFKCLICMDSYTTPLTSIQCWHVHCEECWLRTLGAKKLCPQCNTITSPGDLRRVYL